ncbi:hypothetical protein MVLG_06163 [Microbotryum lychnidis-dioicae p1A1 Lamole]|uniref:Nucleoporin Nup133/Nup155-like N-terminal domain-containing protein n=2 Tax=Microbotryum TaxID=34416 RepID=U5HGF4_USTV1|nr:hypothetical protein MVLG_06163 [Microbotryum lychnidis-dioicae p1A1 Lamole]SGY77406.1 BQ5605_C005g03628 [Microbotryum silenes-dioicae]|eukprot:KDE03357.1 hypothetical protein MVLG_06163 [Microbotryum lychnidis-dioicae p1A1 Lamole]
MYSGLGTPPANSTTPRRVGTPRRAGSRAATRAASQALQSGETTPRASPEPSLAGSHANPSMAQYGRGIYGQPAPQSYGRSLSIAASSRRAQSSIAASSDAGGDGDRRSVVGSRPTEESLDKVLVRDEYYVVLERKGLPVEVQQIVSSADPYVDPFRATLDHTTGFACLVTREYCFVWNWTKRSSASATYVFPLPRTDSLPSNVSTYAPLSFASFVVSSTGSASSRREPGLLVVSTTGELRFWEALSMALSGVERYLGASLSLTEGELVRGLTTLSPTSYVVSTSRSRVLLIALTSVGGRVDVNVRPLERSVGWAGSVWSAVFGGKNAADPTAGILSVAVSPVPSTPDGGKYLIYAVTDTNVHVWDVPLRDDGSERLIVEQDVLAGILEALEGAKVGNEAWATNEQRATILDTAVTASGHLALLVSHVTLTAASKSLSYSIVLLDIGNAQHGVNVVGVRHLHYQAPVDPRPLSSPKINLGPNSIAFVVFVDAVIVTSLEATSAFEETFPLRNNTNRFLGYSSRSNNVNEPLVLLTSTPSILSLQLNSATLPSLATYAAPASEAAKTRQLKVKIEQTVYFGADDATNPLAFDLSPNFEGDLVLAAEAVSSQIASSSSPHAPHIMDLRAQLADRVSRARILIGYIGSNGLLGKLPQSARRRLSWDAERLAGAVALWHHQNSRMGAADSFGLLSNAISNFLNSAGDIVDDPVRLFFRTRVASFANVLEEVYQLARRALSDTSLRSEQRSRMIHEANQAYLLVFTAVARHRQDTRSQYALDQEVLPLEAWSSRASIVEALQWQFEQTDALLRERVREMGSSLEEENIGATGPSEQQNLQAELKKQMVGLAEATFSAFEERLLFLQTGEGEDPNSVKAREWSERYLAQRAKFVKMLVNIGKVTHAYELAERHRDFRSLVELCTDPRRGSPARTDFFLRKYAQEFAFPLYQFYIEKGQFRTLLEQDEVYRPLLTQYLDMTDNQNISWINDIAIGRYAQATEALVSEAQKEIDLVQKKIMLSLGKLSQVAQASRETLGSESLQRAIEALDDKLDLVNTQSMLHQSFLSTLPSSLNFASPSTQAQSITENLTPHLPHALRSLFHHLTLDLLTSRTLSSEDLIDLLTLPMANLIPSPSSSASSDHCTALEILLRSQSSLPHQRYDSALRTIWRRIYLSDAWDQINLPLKEGLSDQELVQALMGTTLFRTLRDLKRREVGEGLGEEQKVVLGPEEAASEYGVGEEEVGPRFEGREGMDRELVSGVVDALTGECERLKESLGREGLGDYCREIERLLAQEEEGGDDVVMI